MCILCNMGQDKSAWAEADKFLGNFADASRAMRQAVEQMRVVVGVCPSGHMSQYDAAHKAMVRILRDWNRVEETREHPATALNTS